MDVLYIYVSYIHKKSNKKAVVSLKSGIVFANGADPDKMPAFHRRLQGLQSTF